LSHTTAVKRRQPELCIFSAYRALNTPSQLYKPVS